MFSSRLSPTIGRVTRAVSETTEFMYLRTRGRIEFESAAATVRGGGWGRLSYEGETIIAFANTENLFIFATRPMQVGSGTLVFPLFLTMYIQFTPRIFPDNVHTLLIRPTPFPIWPGHFARLRYFPYQHVRTVSIYSLPLFSRPRSSLPNFFSYVRSRSFPILSDPITPHAHRSVLVPKNNDINEISKTKQKIDVAAALRGYPVRIRGNSRITRAGTEGFLPETIARNANSGPDPPPPTTI